MSTTSPSSRGRAWWWRWRPRTRRTALHGLAENLDVLRAAVDARGRGLEVLTMPQPRRGRAATAACRCSPELLPRERRGDPAQLRGAGRRGRAPRRRRGWPGARSSRSTRSTWSRAAAASTASPWASPRPDGSVGGQPIEVTRAGEAGRRGAAAGPATPATEPIWAQRSPAPLALTVAAARPKAPHGRARHLRLPGPPVLRAARLPGVRRAATACPTATAATYMASGSTRTQPAPRSAWVISAMTEIAISAGLTAPMSRPAGPWIRASVAASWPSAFSRSSRPAWVRRLPRAAM